MVWTLATIVPYVALAVRRVHDTNKSGWWVLLPGIPYVISEIVNYTAIMPATDRITDTILGVAAGLDEDVATQQLISQMNGPRGPVRARHDLQPDLPDLRTGAHVRRAEAGRCAL